MTTVRLLLADVDGTLVTQDKVLTDRAIGAVHRLHDADITFAVTSGRPPRGMEMLIEPLALTTPISAFNGGLIVEPDMTVIEQKTIPDELVAPIVDKLDRAGVDVWLYRGPDWYVRRRDAPHVDREAFTVQFEPTVVQSFDHMLDSVAKVVGVSDDHDLVERVANDVHDEFGDHVSSARSQPYYVDVTHPQANKGGVITFLSDRYGIPTEQIATIGDMPNDVLMFRRSGFSIAMGHSAEEVKRQAGAVTGSNEEEGFANAVRHYILPKAKP
jgi:Cof subfamily protein (haloacid dehalogenase superfamily)